MLELQLVPVVNELITVEPSVLTIVLVNACIHNSIVTSEGTPLEIVYGYKKAIRRSKYRCPK